MATERDRYYSKPPAQHNLSMSYGFAPEAIGTGLNNITGVWNPFQLDASGNLRVVIVSGGSTTNVDVSGLNLTVGAITLTGAPVVSLTGNTPVNVTNTAPIPFSGVTQANVTNSLIATSGVVTILSLPTQNVAVTGGSILTIVTGAVQSSITNPIGVTGTKLDIASTYSGNPLAPYNFVAVGGRVVSVTGVGSTTGDYSTGANVIMSFASNAGLLVNQGCLESGYDSVTASVQGGNSIPVNVTGIILTQVTGAVSASFDTSSIVLAQASGNTSTANILLAQYSGVNLLTTANQLNSGISGLLSTNLTDPAYITGTVTTLANSSSTSPINTVSGIDNGGWGVALPANPNRKAWGVTNMSNGGPMFVRMGTAVNSGNAHFILKSGIAQMDGQGGSYIDSPAVWLGPVSITGYFSVSPAYMAWEI